MSRHLVFANLTGTTVLYARSGKFSNLLFKAINQDDIHPGKKYFQILPQRRSISVTSLSLELRLTVHCTLTHPLHCEFQNSCWSPWSRSPKGLRIHVCTNSCAYA